MFLKSNYSDSLKVAQYSSNNLGCIEISTTDEPRMGQPIKGRPLLDMNDPGILSQGVDHAVDFIRAAIADYRKNSGYEGRISVVPWPLDEFSTARHDILDQISDLSWDYSDHAESIDDSKLEIGAKPQYYLVYDYNDRRIGSIVSINEDEAFRKAFDELPGAQNRIQKVSHVRSATLTDLVQNRSRVYRLKDAQGLSVETRVAISPQSAINQYSLHASGRQRFVHDAIKTGKTKQADIARQHWLNNGQRRPELGIDNENWRGWVSHLIEEGGQPGYDDVFGGIGNINGEPETKPAWQWPDGSSIPDPSASADFGIWQTPSQVDKGADLKKTSKETDMGTGMSL